MFLALLKHVKLPQPVMEYQFGWAEGRKWRFDYAFLTDKGLPGVALEVEGGIWTGGRHVSGSGFLKDMEKYNRAAVLGWRIIRVTPKELCSMATITLIREALGL